MKNTKLHFKTGDKIKNNLGQIGKIVDIRLTLVSQYSNGRPVLIVNVKGEQIRMEPKNCKKIK